MGRRFRGRVECVRTKVHKNAYTHMYLCAENANTFNAVQHSRRSKGRLIWPSQFKIIQPLIGSLAKLDTFQKVECEVLRIVEPGGSRLKCGAHNLMTETMSLETIGIVSNNK